MSRTPFHRRTVRTVVGALSVCSGVLAMVTGCSAPQSGMMAITVDSQGHPVGLAVGCRYELSSGHLQRRVASPPEHSTGSTAGSAVPGPVENREIASWALPPATEEIVMAVAPSTVCGP
jgi:hypothetical protein